MRSQNHTFAKIGVGVALAVFFTWLLFPFFWIFLFSVKSTADIVAYPPKFIFIPTLKSYIAVMLGKTTGLYSVAPDFPHWLKNSLILSGGSLGLTCLLGLFAAYALAKYKIPGKDSISFTFATICFLPALAVMLPLFTIYHRLKLFDTYPGLILAYQLITLPLFILLLRGYIMEVPQSFIEAAYLDGATEWQVISRIVLPAILPGLMAAALLSFIYAWNNFALALVLAGSHTEPVPLGMLSYIGFTEIQRGQMSAAIVLCIVPAIVFAAFSQKYIVRGFSLGLLKG